MGWGVLENFERINGKKKGFLVDPTWVFGNKEKGLEISRRMIIFSKFFGVFVFVLLLFGVWSEKRRCGFFVGEILFVFFSWENSGEFKRLWSKVAGLKKAFLGFGCSVHIFGGSVETEALFSLLLFSLVYGYVSLLGYLIILFSRLYWFLRFPFCFGGFKRVIMMVENSFLSLSLALSIPYALYS